MTKAINLFKNVLAIIIFVVPFRSDAIAQECSQSFVIEQGKKVPPIALYDYKLEFLSQIPCEYIEKFRQNVLLKIDFISQAFRGEKQLSSIRNEINFLELSIKKLLKASEIEQNKAEIEEVISRSEFITNYVEFIRYNSHEKVRAFFSIVISQCTGKIIATLGDKSNRIYNEILIDYQKRLNEKRNHLEEMQNLISGFNTGLLTNLSFDLCSVVKGYCLQSNEGLSNDISPIKDLKIIR